MDTDAFNANEQDTVHQAADELHVDMSSLLRSVLLSRGSLARSYGAFADYDVYPRLIVRFLGEDYKERLMVQYGGVLVPHSAFQLATAFLEPYAHLRCILLLRSIRDDGLGAHGATLFDLPEHTHDLAVVVTRYEELAEAYRDEHDTLPRSRFLPGTEPTFQCVLWLHACIAIVSNDVLSEEP